MSLLRRILGALVMLAGILGLVLSLAGLVMVWVVKPTLAVHASSTMDTLSESVITSQNAMQVTEEALGATVESVDALSDMLATTAGAVEDTKPVLDQFDSILATTLPATLEAAADSLHAAQEAAQVLESTIQSLDAFRLLLSSTPLVGELLPEAEEAYSPEKPMAESLGALAANLEDLPETFVAMSADLRAADDRLVDIQENLVTMSDSVGLISSSLGEYEQMIRQSRSSMEDLQSILTNMQSNLGTILNGVAIALSLFFAWLLAAQVVIFSQGWELYRGTADRMASELE